MKNSRKYLWIGILGCWFASYSSALSQGTLSSFHFVDNPSFTKLAALGGTNITAANDALMFVSNPALLDSSGHQLASFHFMNFPGGLNVGSFGYTFKRREDKENEIIGIALQYYNYGEFEGFDITGLPMGSFQASEFSLVLGYGRKEGVFRYGINAKLLGSVLESYRSYALAFDIGINFVHPEQDLVFGITAKQVGFVMSTYVEAQNLRLPTDIRIGGSYKPEHMPVRFHGTIRNLVEETDFFLPSPAGDGQRSVGDKIFRRAVFGAEILAHENFQLQIGYNHLVRQEFGMEQRGTAGFSAGFAFRVKKFEFSYASRFYRVAGNANLIGITTNINEWRRF